VGNYQLFVYPPFRAVPRVLMHVDDSGEFPDGQRCGHLVCRKCGHAEWRAAGLTNQRRGLPCPTCNGKGQKARALHPSTAGQEDQSRG
jgi:hypothetical protein